MESEDETAKRQSLPHGSNPCNCDHQSRSDEDHSSSCGTNCNGTESGSSPHRSKRVKYDSGLLDSAERRQSLQEHSLDRGLCRLRSAGESDRSSDNELQEPGAGNLTGGVTILDVLNTDCWRLVLDHISINDIVRSERVSRAWQQVVLDYLPGVRNFRIRYSSWQTKTSKPHKKYSINRLIVCPERASLIKGMIRKMGPFMVTLVWRFVDADGLIVIALHCPKLESVTIHSKSRRNVDLSITGITPEDIANNASLKNLRTLSLYNCGPYITQIHSIIKQLTGLKRLELDRCSRESMESVQLLLDDLPNLEHLSLTGCGPYIKLISVLPAAVGRLGRLRELHLFTNKSVTDELLVSVARGCPELRTVKIGFCYKVTAYGVLTLCRARPPLVELALCRLALTDDDLEACARCCGGLEWLNVSFCEMLTPRLPSRLAWPRARPLLLRAWHTPAYTEQVAKTHYEGLIVE